MGPGTLIASTGQGRIRHFLATEETTLAHCIAENLGLSLDEAQELITFGAVYLARRRATSDCAVSSGQYLRVHLKPRRFPVDGIDWRKTIVYQDTKFVVANKPAGIPVHATLDNRIENLLHELERTLESRLFITHRLDTEVGGLIVLAKTPAFQSQFNRLLAERKVCKRYRALVTAAPEIGRYIHYMAATKRGPKIVSIQAQPNWIYCALSVVKADRSTSAVPAPCAFNIEVDLETGRTHQIRAQLSAIGSPIVGDTLYGSQTAYWLNGTPYPGIALFSSLSSWMTPEGQEYSFQLSPHWMNIGDRL